MARGAWVTGVTAHEVAAHFGVAVNTAEHDAAEASRIIRDAVGSDDELRAQLIATLQHLISMTSNVRQARTAVEAIRVLAGISGAEKPRKVEVAGDVAGLLALAFEAEGGSEEAD